MPSPFIFGLLQIHYFMRPTLLSLFAIIMLSSCFGEKTKWEIQHVPEGNFSIKMPTPVEKDKKMETTAFGKQNRYFVRWKPSSVAIDKFKLFEVSYTNVPPSIIDDSEQLSTMLEVAVELRKKDFSEVDYIESHSIEIDGHPGKAFFYDAPKGNTLTSVKMCVADGKLYDLVVIAKKNYSINQEMSDFFDSFVIGE